MTAPFADVRSARDAALDRTRLALSAHASSPTSIQDPLVVSSIAYMAHRGEAIDPGPLLAWLETRRLHYGRENPMRFRWGLSWRAEPGHASYRPEPGSAPTFWRPAEAELLAADPSGYGRRLIEPITIAAYVQYLGRLTEAGQETDVTRMARALLDEAQPVIEHDVATWFQARDPWRDTFALWLMTSEPQAIERFRDLLFALTLRYGGLAARTKSVVGIRYPFYEQPLVSATAHLASTLWKMGVYPSLLPDLVALVRTAEQPNGAWADPGQPADTLTTLAAADLMAHLEPGYDTTTTASWLIEQQEPAGWWRALGPEVPWLTATVADWLSASAKPFKERFAWPTAPIWTRDRLTGLTTIGTLDEIAIAFEGLPSLGRENIQAAFLDLAGFGEWNGKHGQAAGDALLGVLGESLAALPSVLAVRIGGDEFILLGKPGEDGLPQTLNDWRQRWPSTLAAAAMPAAVAPRILLTRGPAARLSSIRHELGAAISSLKHDEPMPPPHGVLETLPA